MAKKRIRLTESDLHSIIKESVRTILKESNYDNRRSNWGLTGSPERLEMLRKCEDLYDSGNIRCRAYLNKLAARWPEELEDTFGIDYYKGCADKYAYEILCLCDDSELEEILNHCDDGGLFKTDTERGMERLRKQLENPRKIKI